MIADEDGLTAANRDEAVPVEVWRRLYETAGQVRKMEPWLWVEETDIFGVQDTVMEGMCKDLGIEIMPDPELPALTQARQELEGFARRC